MAAAALVLAVVAVGCGDDGGGEPSPTEGPAEPTVAPTDAPATEAGTVTMANFSFDPATIEAGRGDELSLRNDDAAPHTFTVTDADIDVEVAAGATGSATIDLDAGTYDVICRFHEAGGMTATLEVT